MNCNKNPSHRAGLTSMFRVILKYLQPENMALFKQEEVYNNQVATQFLSSLTREMFSDPK